MWDGGFFVEDDSMLRRVILIVCACALGLGLGCDSNSAKNPDNPNNLEYNKEGPPKRQPAQAPK
jgi:hypothetical protein